MAARYVRVGNFPDFRDELRGTIAEILATPTANDNVYGCPDDVAGASLEAKGGKWYGSLGVLTAAQWAGIYTANIGPGATAKVVDASGNVTSYEAVSSGGAVQWLTDVNPTRLSRFLRLATFGDSTADSQYTNTDSESLFSAMPGSGQSWPGESQTATTLQYVFPSILVANGGISGQTTQQFLDRGKSAFAADRKALQDVVAKLPDVVLMHGASINDFLGMGSGFTDADVSNVVDRHRQCVEFFTSAGILVIDSGCYGYSAESANADNVRLALMSGNAKIRKLVSDSKNPLWIWNELDGIVRNSTGRYIPGMSDDNVHLSVLGAFTVGITEKSIISRYYSSGVSGNVAWDQGKDYANGVGGTSPANATRSYGGLTILNSYCDFSKCVYTVRVSAGSESSANMMLSLAKGSGAFSWMKSGDACVIDTFFDVKDSSGNLVNTTSREMVEITNSDNSAKVIYDRFTVRRDGRRYKQIAVPVDFSDMGSNTYMSFGVCGFPAPGDYTVTFRPWRIIKYTPLNTLS